MILKFWFRKNLLGIFFAGGNFNDATKSEPLHAPGVLEPALAVLHPSEEELDVLPFPSVVVALKFPADGVSRRKDQQVQQTLRFRLDLPAQSVWRHFNSNYALINDN